MTIHLALRPRDGFFCKDGRGWTTTATGRTHGLDWPFPSTVRGALRTAWGLEHERARGKRLERHEWPESTSEVTVECLLPLRRRHREPSWGPEHRMWPVPADALFLPDKPDVQRLDPKRQPPCTLGIDPQPTREALWWPRVDSKAKPDRAPRFWPEDEFVAWLAGGPVARPGGDVKGQRRHHEDLSPPKRTDIHLAIDPKTLTAQKSQLYSIEVVEPLTRHWEWALGLACRLPTELSAGAPLLLGGDRRIVPWEPVPESTFAFPTALEAAFLARPLGLRLVVATPAHFPEGWLLPGFETEGDEYRGTLAGIHGELKLRAALVPRPVHVSGWDMAAGGPKPTRRLVPSGSVYFLTRAGGFTPEEARRLWFAPIGEDTKDGFGRVVPGVWTPAKEND